MYTNIKLEWVAPYGPNKGKKVSSWFQFADPDIERLKREYDAVEVARV